MMRGQSAYSADRGVLGSATIALGKPYLVQLQVPLQLPEGGLRAGVGGAQDVQDLAHGAHHINEAQHPLAQLRLAARHAQHLQSANAACG